MKKIINYEFVSELKVDRDYHCKFCGLTLHDETSRIEVRSLRGTFIYAYCMPNMDISVESDANSCYRKNLDYFYDMAKVNRYEDLITPGNVFP